MRQHLVEEEQHRRTHMGQETKLKRDEIKRLVPRSAFELRLMNNLARIQRDVMGVDVDPVPGQLPPLREELFSA